MNNTKSRFTEIVNNEIKHKKERNHVFAVKLNAPL